MAAAPIPWRLLGNVLVNRGSLSEEQLEAALIQQAVSGGRLGEILVARGAIPHATLSLALAEQYGIDPSVESGFGTGLRVALQGSPPEHRPEPVLQLVAPAEPEAPQTPEPEEQPEPLRAQVLGLLARRRSQPPVGHLVFVQLDGGYELIERDGAPPACDAHLELVDFPGMVFVVTTLGRSPLPHDPRSCVFAQRALN